MHLPTHAVLLSGAAILVLAVHAAPRLSPQQDYRHSQTMSAFRNNLPEEKRDDMFQYPNTDPDTGGRGRPPALDLTSVGYGQFYDGNAKIKEKRQSSGGMVQMSCQSCVTFCHMTNWDSATTQADCVACGQQCYEMYSAYKKDGLS